MRLIVIQTFSKRSNYCLPDIYKIYHNKINLKIIDTPMPEIELKKYILPYTTIIVFNIKLGLSGA